MHLRSLTIKGFKSFAQATTFAFEPGVTCIVGPNGSGKSNVVDALAWVMGEQGAKNLRGGSMADVIFAGTATRGPLGRAEVVLTIDNADGALPIEYAEVAISRTLFRDGRSEYAINGDAARLLDVQELLSDSGLGREMHVIVGQGQLDAVLRASPEERRGFVEEAAGILKHRRRKERTLRKLDAMQANLTRLADLAEELRRQLKPLGAQAETAREAAGIQADVRSARTRLLAFDAALLRDTAARLERERQDVAGELDAAQDADRVLGRRVAQLEAAGDGAELDAARRTALELDSAQERVRALAQAAATRVALLAPEPGGVGPGAAATAAERRAVADAIAQAASRLDTVRAAEAQSRQAQADAQQALDAVEARIAADTAALAAHDRAIAAARARAAVAESRLAAAGADADRRAAALAAARDRAATAAAALPGEPPPPPQQAQVGDLEQTATARAAAADEVRSAAHDLDRRLAAADARVAALAAATAVPASAAEVLRALPEAMRVQDAIEVDPPWAAAIGAALGVLADAAVLPLPDPAAVRAAAQRVAALGGVDIVAAQAPAADPLPAGSAAAVVRGPAGVTALLADIVLADDLDAALDAAGRGATAVTRAGEVVTPHRIRTAGAGASAVELVAERDAAQAEAARLREAAGQAQQRFAAARADAQQAAADLSAATAAERQRQQAARAEERRRADLAARADAAAAEVRRLDGQAQEAAAAVVAATAARDSAAAEVGVAEAAERPVVAPAARAEVAADLDGAREAALAARLETQTLVERLRADRDRLASLERQAQQAEAAAEAAARRAAQGAVQRAAAETVLAELPAWQTAVDASVAAARVRLDGLERQRAERGGELRAARQRLAEARAAVAELDSRGRDLEMHAYEQRVSLGAVLERALAEVGLDEPALAAEADRELDRAAEERRLAAAERRLARLGRVNPLALEEFAALEQRHVFLAEQLADLHRTRADLLTIVEDLDTRIATIFAAAFADTEQAFARIFPVLFPGGTGRLSLTDDDGGGPGIEVAVRPAGKKIERLSLLSGGERSLAAVAFLLAIFTARPSPFYILDEVEAALDDANLGRLLEVVSALRERSQLILITHQKRTMEIADALYGVSMRQDGVSQVIGQRMAQRT